MRDDALDVVLETLSALRKGGQVTERSRLWLQDGLTRFLNGAPLDGALGMKPGAGQTAVGRQYLLAIRNHYLHVAWLLCHGTPWQRSMELARHVARFSCRAWPRVCDREVPPLHFGEIDRALFAAFTAGEVPASAKRLGQIVSEPKYPILVSEKHLYDFHDRQ